MLRFTYIVIIAFTAAQCSSLFYGSESQTGNRVPVEVNLEPDYDLYELRVDLYRKEKSANSAQETREDEDYSPLGFSLGGGMFYDLNGNLSFDVIRMLGIDRFSDFTIKARVPSVFGSMQDTYYVKRGSEYYKSNRLDSKSIFGTSRVINRRGKAIEIKDGPLSKFTIEKENNQLSLSNFLSNKVIHTVGPSKYRVGGFLVEENIEYRDGTIMLDNEFRIRKEGLDLIIEQNQFWSFTEVWRISQNDENILYIYRRDKLIMKILQFDREIVVEQNGKVKKSYELMEHSLRSHN